jgi:iron complex transport system substrate-binding protein
MKRFTSLAALAAFLITATACGDDSSTGGGDAPKAIISLSPTHTEVLFALGAGDQIIAVDEMSNYPAEALEKPHDLSGFEPNVEAIAALKPDLVVIGNDFKGLAAQLEPLGIATWVSPAPATLDEVYAQIEQLGAATGHVGDAAELVGQMQSDIAAAVASVPPSTRSTPVTYFHEVDPTLYTLTGNTIFGQVYGLFGLQNIADGVEEGNDYPQLSAEYVVSSNPDLIFLADTNWSGESPETVAARPGWGEIAAVQNGNVVVIDDDIASRWGPRLVDFVKAVAAALAAVPAA